MIVTSLGTVMVTLDAGPAGSVMVTGLAEVVMVIVDAGPAGAVIVT